MKVSKPNITIPANVLICILGVWIGLLGIPITNWAQHPFFQFDHNVLFGPEDGIPNKELWRIIKGQNGYIWLGTANGLCRFDGNKIKTYKNDPENPHSLLDDRVVALLSTTDKIWTGTALGISILDLKSDTFTNYKIGANGKTDSLSFERESEISALFQDNNGQIWIGTRYFGVQKYDPVSDNFISFPYTGPIDQENFHDASEVNYIKSFIQAPGNDSIIWAGTNIGILEINQYTHQVHLYNYPLEDKFEQRQFNIFRRLHYHDDGLIYASSWGPGIRTFNPKTKEHKYIKLKESTPGDAILEYGASYIIRKSPTELWLSNSKGLVLYNTEKQKLTYFIWNDLKDEQYYEVNLLGEDGRIWWISEKGLHLLDPFLQQYQPFSYKNINEGGWGFAFYLAQHSKDQIISVFPLEGDGLFHLDKNTRTWTKTPFPHRPNLPLRYKSSRILEKDPDGNLTLVSEYGLFTYKVATGDINPFPFQPALENRNIRRIFWDSRGLFWVLAGPDGLIRWNPKTTEARNYKEELEASAPNTPVQLNHITLEDSKGNIWMRRMKGISVYLHERDTILNFLYQQQPDKVFNAIFSFAEDRYGRIWVTSEENWMGYIDVNHPENGIVEKINLDQFHIPGMIDLACTDLNGDLWITTSKSLIHFDVENFVFTPHSHDYGFDGAEKFSVRSLPTGELVFGERNHITLTKPEDLKLNKDLPHPYVSNIKVLNEPYPLDTSILYKKQLNLAYNENFFSIAFSALSFRLGKMTKFRYRLKDFEDWAEADDRHFANYTNVPSGSYTFQLQAANNEGIWNPAIYELAIVIATPWWATWWFRIIVLLSILGLLYAYYQSRLIRIRQRERLKTEFNKKLANVEMTALLAQMNPHFLFNCLNSIDSYILNNKSREASEYLNNFARLIRLILQNSQSNYISLKDELETLELYLMMESIRLKDKFQYQIKVDENLDISTVDIPPMLIQPYVENAIWHGLMNKPNKKEGLLTISISQVAGILKCIVEDNGIGRNHAARLKREKTSTKRKSMGMTITKNRIELINQLYNLEAKVSIKDLVGPNGESLGTQVTLDIPI